MTFRKTAAASLLLLGTLALAAPAASFAETGSSTVASVDTDKDGTIDMTEAKKAAMDNFAMLDKDSDGTLDSKEAGMDVANVDPDKDGTVDKKEFAMALADTFKAADTDRDGTIDAKELATPDGQKLATMMK